MSEKIILPPRTTGYLAGGATEGQRHTECKAAAMQLRDAGVSRSETESTLCSRGERDGMDRKEVVKIIDWAFGKSPRDPIIVGNSGPVIRTITPPATKPRSPVDHAGWWLTNAELNEDAFAAKSQLPIPENHAEALKLFLEMLYQGGDQINFVGKFIEEGGKARPCGGGKSLTRDNWLKEISLTGVPHSRAGMWFRPNPCGIGSGKDGAVMDSDILTFRFLLLESDVLPLPIQFALFAKLKLPIAAAYLSGGASVHALVNIGAKNSDEFARIALRITSALKGFGIDQANKNPSRLSRLPGALRVIGSSDPLGSAQKLLWLNPACKPITEVDIDRFESSLSFPAVDEKPFKRIINEAIARYEELNSNPGIIGTPTGLVDFDHDTGGLQNGQMTVIAAQTNGGKSSLAMNILNGALQAGKGAVLFTLEMGSDEIADLFFAMNCQVDRNNFNTGRFTEGEMRSMIANVGKISNLPLWVYDESTLTVQQIRQRILALKAEGLISLAVVDYAQIVTPENYDLNREQQVAGIARALCACAKDAKIPLVILSQLNDDNRLRESRVIAHEAHNVLLIENHEEDNRMVMKVIKGRRIRKKDYELFYEPRFCRIKSMTRISESDIPKSTHNDP